MAITLNHIIVPARDKEAAARLFAHLFGLAYKGASEHFVPVKVNDTLTFFFDDRWRNGPALSKPLARFGAMGGALARGWALRPGGRPSTDEHQRSRASPLQTSMRDDHDLLCRD